MVNVFDIHTLQPTQQCKFATDTYCHGICGDNLLLSMEHTNKITPFILPAYITLRDLRAPDGSTILWSDDAAGRLSIEKFDNEKVLCHIQRRCKVWNSSIEMIDLRMPSQPIEMAKFRDRRVASCGSGSVLHGNCFIFKSTLSIPYMLDLRLGPHVKPLPPFCRNHFCVTDGDALAMHNQNMVLANDDYAQLLKFW